MRTLIVLLTVATTAYSQMDFKNVAIEKLDYESQLCMKCHNGSNGNEITIREKESPVQYDNLNRTNNHSVGMNYFSSYRKDPRHYISPALLNPKINLVDGKIGCVSCHVAKNKILASNSESFLVDDGCSYDKKATQEAFQNGLCTQCHQK